MASTVTTGFRSRLILAGVGLLTLASEDPQRFYPEMGTMYLKRLGDSVSAALGRSLAG